MRNGYLQSMYNTRRFVCLLQLFVFKRRCFTERLDSVVVDVLYFVAIFKRESHVSFRVYLTPRHSASCGVSDSGDGACD